MTKTANQRVIVGMSGGVDSSVSAALLKEQGYEVIGVMYRLWKDKTFIQSDHTISCKTKCCSLQSQRNAEKIADFLDIPFFVVDYTKYFKDHIVDYYLEMYEHGLTPNPCALCNQEIKFGLMIETMKEHNADFVATGHYCRKGEENGIYHILKGVDATKDQSYFLYHMTQEKLKHVLWPVGPFSKKEIIAKAEELGLPVTFEKESQDICFIPDKDPKEFLKRHLPAGKLQPGVIKTTAGTILKEQHKGLPLYTRGQRKGIEIGGLADPLYVVDLDYDTNTLIVGSEQDLDNYELTADNLNFIAGSPFESPRTLDIKVRYSTETHPAEVTIEGATALVRFTTPMRAIAPGQVISFYKGDELLGGGIIISGS